MPISTGDVVKLVVEAVLNDGSIVQNVFYFLASLTSPEPDASALAALEVWVETAYTNLLTHITNDVVFSDIVADIIEWSGTKWETVYHIGIEDVDLAPTAVDDQLPNQVSPFVTFNTLRPKSKGRKFLYGFSEAQTSASYVIAGTLANMVLYAADCMENIVFAPLNTLTPGVIRKGFDVFLPFQSATVTNVVGTQRRRRPGVGI